MVSTQHDAAIEDMNVIKADMVDYVIAPVMDTVGIEWHDAEVYVNPTGRFVVGGPMGDTGLTGRKIIVDTYGGMGRHGGGCFSGKDCTKVDRSAAYAARWVAKNVVGGGAGEALRGAAGLRDRRLPPALRDGGHLRHGLGGRRCDRGRRGTGLLTCARARSSATSTCAGPSTRRPRPTATLAASCPSSPGSAATRVDELRAAVEALG